MTPQSILLSLPFVFYLAGQIYAIFLGLLIPSIFSQTRDKIIEIPKLLAFLLLNAIGQGIYVVALYFFTIFSSNIAGFNLLMGIGVIALVYVDRKHETPLLELHLKGIKHWNLILSAIFVFLLIVIQIDSVARDFYMSIGTSSKDPIDWLAQAIMVKEDGILLADSYPKGFPIAVHLYFQFYYGAEYMFYLQFFKSLPFFTAVKVSIAMGLILYQFVKSKLVILAIPFMVVAYNVHINHVARYYCPLPSTYVNELLVGLIISLLYLEKGSYQIHGWLCASMFIVHPYNAIFYIFATLLFLVRQSIIVLYKSIKDKKVDRLKPTIIGLLMFGIALLIPFLIWGWNVYSVRQTNPFNAYLKRFGLLQLPISVNSFFFDFLGTLIEYFKYMANEGHRIFLDTDLRYRQFGNFRAYYVLFLAFLPWELLIKQKGFKNVCIFLSNVILICVFYRSIELFYRDLGRAVDLSPYAWADHLEQIFQGSVFQIFKYRTAWIIFVPSLLLFLISTGVIHAGIQKCLKQIGTLEVFKQPRTWIDTSRTRIILTKCIHNHALPLLFLLIIVSYTNHRHLGTGSWNGGTLQYHYHHTDDAWNTGIALRNELNNWDEPPSIYISKSVFTIWRISYGYTRRQFNIRSFTLESANEFDAYFTTINTPALIVIPVEDVSLMPSFIWNTADIVYQTNTSYILSFQ